MQTSRFLRLCLILGALALAPAVLADAGFVTRARAAAQILGAELKTALLAAINEKGPVHAIAVCNTRAPEITARAEQQTGLKVGRTALRVRNPANAPTDWQRDVLRMFQRRLAQGEAPADIEWHAAVTTATGVEQRYMKPIMMGPLCLTCHGAQLAPEVAAAIRERYPNDQATGFAVGELRGAFVVVQDAGE